MTKRLPLAKKKKKNVYFYHREVKEMKRKVILVAIILMAVGFAAVSTTLYINGVVGVSTNLKDLKKV